jgi:ATP-dependent DNA helicase RecQ
MYSPSDIIKQKLLIQTNITDPLRLKIQYENLQYLVNYCHADSCLRNEITSYFGEERELDNCGSCGNCLDETDFVNMTIEAQKIMSLIYRSGQRFGLNMIIQTLRGSKNQKILSWNLDQQSTYGSLKEYSEASLREIIMNLIARGYLLMTTDKFPVLKLTAASKPVLKGEEAIMVKETRKAVKETKTKRKSSKKASFRDSDHENFDEKLYELLAETRKNIGIKKKVPLYLIFSNATLEEIAYYQPQTKEDFLNIKGVGENKYNTYGEIFMDIVKEHKNVL